MDETFQSFIVLLQKQRLNLCVISSTYHFFFFLILNHLSNLGLPTFSNMSIKHSYKIIKLIIPSLLQITSFI